MLVCLLRGGVGMGFRGFFFACFGSGKALALERVPGAA